MPGVIYSKLKVYYEGLVKNVRFLSSRTDDLESAFADIMIGKYNHTDSQEMKLVKSLISAE